MKSVLTAIGTRPEAIKLAPVLAAMQRKASFTTEVCITSQHKDLIHPFLSKPEIQVNYLLDSNEGHLSLHQSAATMLNQFGQVLQKSMPDIVVVQGDTTTAFVAALAAFYAQIPVAHIEAGLRTGHRYTPWPEEIHRSLITRLANFFFAPTPLAQNTLLKAGIPPERIWMVGNTSIDAIRLERKSWQNRRAPKERIILATVHRRENQGAPLRDICRALRVVAETYPDVKIRFFLHPIPGDSKPATEMLSGVENIEFCKPVDHPTFIRLLFDSHFVITDSGGIQEEAPSMGKPVLVIRNTTERPEGVEAGLSFLAGTDKNAIVERCGQLLKNEGPNIENISNPYGDGNAAKRIIDALHEF